MSKDQVEGNPKPNLLPRCLHNAVEDWLVGHFSRKCHSSLRHFYLLADYQFPCSLTCRARKLKCDERRPRCKNCQKAKRECRPSDGIVFRHQQNASMNGTGNASGSDGNLPGFYSYKNTFSPDSIWLEIPKKGEHIFTYQIQYLTSTSHLRQCHGSICGRSGGSCAHLTRRLHICPNTSRLGPSCFLQKQI